jgi:phage terminase Nu1 subunit (DNA packaging protein)
MLEKVDKLDITVVNSITLGDAWGITDRRVRQLVDEGVIEPVSRGKYNFFECTRKYCGYLRQISEAGTEKKEVKLDYDTERAAHEKIKREKSELQLKVMRGELHRSEDVEFVMTNIIANAKARLLSIPPKAAPMLIGYSNISKIQDILQKHIEEALKELSEYDSELFINDDVLQQGDGDD